MTSPYPEAHVIKTKDIHIMQEIVKALGVGYQKPESKIRTHYYLNSHICKSFESSKSGTEGRYIYYIYIISCYVTHVYDILL